MLWPPSHQKDSDMDPEALHAVRADRNVRSCQLVCTLSNELLTLQKKNAVINRVDLHVR